MKYIRTKDGIYEVVGFDNECIIPSPIIKMNSKLTHCSDYKNCKQADTIEELCDKFVAETCDNTKFWVEPTLENVKMYCGIKNIYGAVWTDKGLIFVAKINDKGELELI